MRAAFGVLCAVLAASSTAQAQYIDNIGNAGQVVIGAERLAGVFVDQADTELSATLGGETVSAESSATTTTVAILGSDPGGPTGVPRLALDFFVTDGFSIGGSFIYLVRSGDAETTVSRVGASTTNESELPTQTLFVLAPRIGYAFAFDETVALWPRIGFTYSSDSEEEESEDVDDFGNPITVTDTTTAKATQLTLEALLVISPFTGFALAGGPFFDVGLGGSLESESDAPGAPTVQGDYLAKAYGFTLGILAYF